MGPDGPEGRNASARRVIGFKTDLRKIIAEKVSDKVKDPAKSVLSRD